MARSGGQSINRLQQYYDDVRVLGGQVIEVVNDDAAEVELIDRRTRQKSGAKRQVSKKCNARDTLHALLIGAAEASACRSLRRRH